MLEESWASASFFIWTCYTTYVSSSVALCEVRMLALNERPVETVETNGEDDEPR